MIYKDELKFESDVIHKLAEHGWSKIVLKNKTEKDLIDNWADILYQNNKGIDRLNNEPLTDGEKSQLIEQINKLKSPLMLNRFVNGKTIFIIRDNPNDKLHFGKEVALDIYDRNQIAGGKSVYQIVEQPIFSAKNAMLNSRRGDLMLLINGMPLIHIELKRSGVPVSQAIEQIKKYSHEHVFTGLFSLIQVFVAMNPKETRYFANPGDDGYFNDKFYFEWADKNNEPFSSWDKVIQQLLSIPMAHKLIGFYTVPDESDGVLKVMRSYQVYACEAISNRTAKAKWTYADRLGGYIWHTTGSGKTMTSFKSAQLISQSNLADKVVFLIDRVELGIQSAAAYRSYMDERENVQETSNTYELISKLKSKDVSNNLIVTSIQKMSNIKLDETVNSKDIEIINSKRIVFIVDECHRSTFGEMLATIKSTFPCALYFGFTGTPIYEENQKHDNTTVTVFGNELHRYCIADGIRDKNVLGFDPSMVLTFADKDLKKAVALNEAGASSVEEVLQNPQKKAKYYEIYNLPMSGHYEVIGGEQKYIKGIEDFIPQSQYKLDKGDPNNGIVPKAKEKQHPYQVVKNILDNWLTLSVGGKFHAIFATSSIAEACDYYNLFKEMMGESGRPALKIAGVFDETIGNDKNAIPKEEVLISILSDYNNSFKQTFTIPTYSLYKKDVAERLSHKNKYIRIEKDHPDQQLDLVIVVDQMLTGFDSKWINTLYLDKRVRYQNLIQAFSRTNRIFGKDKPFGIIKYYRYPHSMERDIDEAFKLYSGSKPCQVFVDKLEENLNQINCFYKIIESVFKENNIDNFSTIENMPLSDWAMFAKSFSTLVKLVIASIIQGFVWKKDTYYFDHGDNVTYVKVLLDEKTYKVLAQRYKELFSVSSTPLGANPLDNQLDIDATAFEINTDKIDDDYLNGKFKKWLFALYDDKNDSEVVENLSQQLHNSFASLSRVDQKYAEQILFDLKNGTFKIEQNECKTFSDYINEYKVKAMNDQIHKFAFKIGIDEEKLRLLISFKPNASNLNDYGRFDELRKTLNANIAQEYFLGKDGKKYPLPLIISKAENLIRDFIIQGGYDL